MAIGLRVPFRVFRTPIRKEFHMHVKRAAVTAGLSLATVSLATLGLTSPAHAAETRSASGEPTFDCILQPFKSAFPYSGPLTLTATESEGAVKLAAELSDIPGLAPVDIEGGKMRMSLEGTIGSTPFELTGKSTVDAAMHADVAVPTLTGEVPVAAGNVVLTKFTFEFDEMMGLDITSGCDAGRGAELGLLSAGAPADASDETTQAASAEKGDAEAKDEESSAMPMILGGGAAVVVLGGAAAWFVGSRRTA